MMGIEQIKTWEHRVRRAWYIPYPGDDEESKQLRATCGPYACLIDVVEAFIDKNGKPHIWTEDSVGPGGDNLKDLRRSHRMIAKAIRDAAAGRKSVIEEFDRIPEAQKAKARKWAKANSFFRA